MQISVRDAKDALGDLLDRAQAGEEVILTRDGVDVAKIIPLKPQLTREQRRTILDEIRAKAPPNTQDEPLADRSHDDLYDSDGLPA